MVIFNYLNVISVKIQITYYYIFSSKTFYEPKNYGGAHEINFKHYYTIIDLNIIFCIFLVNMC